jgi:hypothetical protein
LTGAGFPSVHTDWLGNGHTHLTTMSFSRSQNDGEKMRNINLRNCVLPASLLAITMAATITPGCSTGSGSSSGGAGTTGTSAGTAGTGTSAGTAGTGTSAGTAGTGTSAGTAGSGTSAGTAGTGTSAGTAGSTGTGTGTAGSTGTGGAAVTTGVCAGMGTRVLGLDQGKVDDFEEATILPGWSSFNDVQPTSNAFKIAQDTGGAIGTAHSGHYMGTGAKTPVMGGFGVGTIYNMAIDKTAGTYCVDVSAFDGVTFWAKAATAGAKVGVNFVVPATNMAPDGDCPGPTGCYNHPQKLVTLTADWAQYSVAFSAAMGGTGAKVMGRIQQLGFLSPDSNWDFSIDEIQLYKGTPPTTPVGGNSTM